MSKTTYTDMISNHSLQATDTPTRESSPLKRLASMFATEPRRSIIGLLTVAIGFVLAPQAARADAVYISAIDGTPQACDEGCYCSYDEHGNEVVRDYETGEVLAPVASSANGACWETCDQGSLPELPEGTLESLDERVRDGGLKREFVFEDGASPYDRVLMSEDEMFETADSVTEIDYGYGVGEGDIQAARVLVCDIYQCYLFDSPANSCADFNMEPGHLYSIGLAGAGYCMN
ncbi:MAG: hypothetical protein Tsb0020_45180 [Haliangiales bacterium]